MERENHKRQTDTEVELTAHRGRFRTDDPWVAVVLAVVLAMMILGVVAIMKT